MTSVLIAVVWWVGVLACAMCALLVLVMVAVVIAERHAPVNPDDADHTVTNDAIARTVDEWIDSVLGAATAERTVDE